MSRRSRPARPPPAHRGADRGSHRRAGRARPPRRPGPLHCGTGSSSRRATKSFGHCSAGTCAGPYQLQAAIQAVHADAATAEATDWQQILALYDQLVAVLPTPVVALNRAVALAEVEGPKRRYRSSTPSASTTDMSRSTRSEVSCSSV